MRYAVPDLSHGQRHESELEVEKSRFLAWVCHAPDAAAFEALLGEARRLHPNASHHCSAFIAGPPGEQTAIGFSDDGEPGGTAGRPMFQVLDGAALGQVGCVVIRYFGGTKLGTGGWPAPTPGPSPRRWRPCPAARWSSARRCASGSTSPARPRPAPG